MSADPQTDPVIRRATGRDLPSIGRLGALIVEQHHRLDQRRFLAPWKGTPADYASFLGTQLDHPAAIILVVEDRGDVIGYAFATVEGFDFMSLRGPAGILQDIIVDPNYRGRGLGRMLLDAVLAELKSRGAPMVVLSTATGNETAQRLIAQAGFRRTMIEMTRELNGDAS